jgi:succinyl-diaminopimelate desuccinylase
MDPTVDVPLELTDSLLADVVELTRAICDVESVSGNERRLADAVEAALRRFDHLEVLRDGDAVVARTALERPERVLLAGHLDTVPLARRPDGSINVPTRMIGEGPDAVLSGRGTVDMKGGVAVQLHLAATLTEPVRDVTYVFYDHEEVDAASNGLLRLVERHPDWITGDFGVLLEPTDGTVEGGCQGTLRVEVTTRGVAAHSARSWMGHNAIHDAGQVLARAAAYRPRTVNVDGLVYREGLNAVGITGGVAGNVIPDRCTVTLNYRFAPDRSAQAALAHLRELLDGYEVEVVDIAAGARPGLDHPAAAAFVAAIGQDPRPKYGWTDVARLSSRGIPAVNFGPGDALLAHRDEEQVPIRQLRECARALHAWLSPQQPPPGRGRR